MKITRSQLVEKITASKGNLFCQVLSLTDSKARKTNNPFGVIMKRSAACVSIGTDYENAVNRVAEKEGNASAGEFIAESIWGGKGEHLVPNKIIRHVDKGTLYLYCQASDKQLDAFSPNVEFETVTGEKLSREDVAPFLPVKAPSAKQAAFGNENERHVRMIALDNVLAIKMMGEVYEVEG